MTQGNITFNNVKQTIDFGMGPVGIAGQTGVDSEWGGVINAIDIDWNCAYLPNVTLSNLEDNNKINTTGDLLYLINDMQGQINLLAELVSSYIG